MKSLNQIDKHSIHYGRTTIEFNLIQMDRKTVEIAVHPDSTVIVKAPTQSDLTCIKARVLKRARWILKQSSYFKQFEPRTPNRSFVGGETHLYLGKQYRLRLVKGTVDSVKLSHGKFHITSCNKPTPEKAKKLLDQWYLEKAQLQFAESMDRCWQNFEKLGVDKPRVSIKRMQRRWGSLSSNRMVTLNTELIKAPKECIDYVVTHELCHLKHHDHSAEFYKLLDSVIPKWKNVKHILELRMA